MKFTRHAEWNGNLSGSEAGCQVGHDRQVVKWVGLVRMVRTGRAMTMDGDPRLPDVKFTRHRECALDSSCGSAAWRMRGKKPHSAHRMPLQRPVGAMSVSNEFHGVILADSLSKFLRQIPRADSPADSSVLYLVPSPGPRFLPVKFTRHRECAFDCFCGSSAWRMRGKYRIRHVGCHCRGLYARCPCRMNFTESPEQIL